MKTHWRLKEPGLVDFHIKCGKNKVFHENCPAGVYGPNFGYLADSSDVTFSELHHQGVHRCPCKYPPRKNSSDSTFELNYRRVSTAGVPGVRNSCPHSHWPCLHCRVRPLGDVTSFDHHIIMVRQFLPQCQPSELSTAKIIGRSGVLPMWHFVCKRYLRTHQYVITY